MVSSPVEGGTNQGSNPGGIKKNSLAGHPKNSGRMLACGTCGWFGPSYQGRLQWSLTEWVVVGLGNGAAL